MLVLTRRVGETIVIDGTIRVTVVSVRGDRMRLGVSAPEAVRVDREEVHDRRWQQVDGNRSRSCAGRALANALAGLDRQEVCRQVR